MANETGSGTSSADSVAVFAAALSLWKAIHERAQASPGINLSDCYNGMDQLMREVMRIASLFEDWACQRVEFHGLSDVWPYLLEDKFGDACLEVFELGGFAGFDETDCLRVAIGLGLPVALDDALPLPIDLRAANPVAGSLFREFRIQTVRDSLEDGDVVAFTSTDDPFDEEFGPRYFGIYGIGADGLPEHIADRSNYSEALALAQKLAPGIEFPSHYAFSKQQPPSSSSS